MGLEAIRRVYLPVEEKREPHQLKDGAIGELYHDILCEQILGSLAKKRGLFL